MRANKDITNAAVREAAAMEIFKNSTTKTYTDDDAGNKDAKMDFEKAKREGAKAGLADTMKDCKTAGKDDCEAVAEQAFADSMGLTKADSVDFKAEYELFKKDAAASAAVKKTSACKEEAGTNAAKLAECATPVSYTHLTLPTMLLV